MSEKQKIEMYYKGLKTEQVMNEFISCVDGILVLEQSVKLWKNYSHHVAETYSCLMEIMWQNRKHKTQQSQVSFQAMLNQVSLEQEDEINTLHSKIIINMRKERDLVHRILNFSDAILNEQDELEGIKKLGLHIAELFVDKTQTAIELLNELSIRLSTPVACLVVCIGLENLKQRDPINATHAALNFLSELRVADNYTQRIFQKQLQAISI